MKINVHIERLVVTGSAPTPPERAALQSDIRQQLALLLRDGYAPAMARRDCTAQAANGPGESIARPAPRTAGRQIAEAVHARITG